MSRRLTLLLGAAAALAAAPVPAGAADFGDAPDGTPGAYLSAAAVVAKFPSRAASGGPRHVATTLHLGPRATSEPDARLPDRDTDDGVGVERLQACGASRINVLVDARRLPAAQRGGTAILNVWADWNKDGDWGDGGCGDEWAVPNQPIALADLGPDGVGFFPITLTGGSQVDEFAMRVTLTLNEESAQPTGRGGAQPYANGETEDYLVVRKGNSRFGVRKTTRRAFARRENAAAAQRRRTFNVWCEPNPAQIAHGDSVRIAFIVVDGDPEAGPIHGDVPAGANGASSRYHRTLNPARNQAGAPPGETIVDSWTFESRRKHATNANSLVESVTTTFVFRRPGSGAQTLKCRVNVIHEKKQPPPPPEKRKKKEEPKPPPENPPTSTTPPPGGGGGQPAPPAPKCEGVALRAAASPFGGGTGSDHVELAATGCNREIGTVEITSLDGETFVASNCAGGSQSVNPPDAKMTGCTNSGNKSTSTWNLEAGKPLKYYAEVQNPPPTGRFEVVIKDKSGAEVFRGTFTLS